jgi:hypothetical protein
MLGSPPAGLRFELVLPDGDLEGRDDPFLALSDSGRFARVLLARVAMGPTPLRTVALKMRRAAPRTPGTPPPNPAVDERWDRELATLRAVSSPDVVRLLDPGPGADRAGPVTFCRKMRLAFHPLCPECMAPLRDCRDDALLRSSGLPPYSESSVRYLYCSACSAKRAGGSAVFYGESAQAGGGSAEVRGWNRLARDGGAILRAPISAETRDRLQREFPCYGCQHRDECYSESSDGSGPVVAESRLMPLSPFDLQVIPMEVLPLRFDEFADLLGGAGWSEVRARALAEPGGAGRESVLAPLDAVLASPLRWLHGNDRTGRLPLEVLRLKLALFGQAARGVRAVHEAAGRALLDLGPSSVMVDVGGSGTDLPALWSFRAKVIDVGGEDPGPEGAPPAADVRGLARLYFRALLVNDAQDEATVTAAVERVAEKLQGSGAGDARTVAGRLQSHLESERRVFDRSAVVYPQALRDGRENQIPPAFWADLLTFGFRLEAPIPGFGFAVAPEGATAGPVDRALTDFDLLLRRAQVELTARADRSREILRACDALLAEFGGGEAPAAPARRTTESTRVR